MTLLSNGFFFFGLLLWGKWDVSSPHEGSNLHWKGRVLTTAPPGKFLQGTVLMELFLLFLSLWGVCVCVCVCARAQ